MDDYLSKYTGAQIDLVISSGSTVSGKIIAIGDISSSAVIIGNTFGGELPTSISGSFTSLSSSISTRLTDEVTFNYITASGNISASGVITGEGLVISDDAEITDNLTVGGDLDVGDTIYHTGDSNTKIRFPENDTISFHTSGDQQMRIDAAGNITASGVISSSGGFVGTLTGQASSVENALTVDDVTLQLNSGTTYDGSGARTISIKDGGVDSDALASDIELSKLTSGEITASTISASGNVILSSVLSFDSTGYAVPYTLNNLTSTEVDGGYRLPFVIASGSSVAGSVINISGSDGNAFVGIGTSYLKRTPKTLTVAGDISASGDFLAKSTSTGSIGSIILTNLPKTDPLVTGSLWVSSSSVNADNKPAGYVMVSGIHG